MNKYVWNSFKRELIKIANMNPMQSPINAQKAPNVQTNIAKQVGMQQGPMTPPVPTVFKAPPAPPPFPTSRINTAQDMVQQLPQGHMNTLPTNTLY